MGGADLEAFQDMTVDKDCNVYIIGYFGPTSTTLTSNSPGTNVLLTNLTGTTDAFWASFDSAGVIRWTKIVGGFGTETTWDIDINKKGNIICSGLFSTSCNFGNGLILTSAGLGDAFVCSINPTTGNTINVVKMGGTGDDHCFGTTSDKIGNIFACGFFTNTASFGTNSLTSAGAEDSYFAKIAPLAPFKLKNPSLINLCNNDSIILQPIDSIKGISFQ